MKRLRAWWWDLTDVELWREGLGDLRAWVADALVRLAWRVEWRQAGYTLDVLRRRRARR